MTDSNKIPLLYGLIAASIMAALWLVLALTRVDLMIKGPAHFLIWLPTLICMFVGIMHLRRAEGGNIRFIRALLGAILIGLLAAILFEAWNLLLHHVLVPDLADKQLPYAVENARAFIGSEQAEAMDVTEEDVLARIATMEEEGIRPNVLFALRKLGFSTAVTVFFGSFFAAIVLAWQTFQNDKPNEA